MRLEVILPAQTRLSEGVILSATEVFYMALKTTYMRSGRCGSLTLLSRPAPTLFLFFYRFCSVRSNSNL